ncbi:MAG: hypothetical protein HQ592_14870, partial [Planctomycetes bacterium]|nr:hypothetical protein [Planctomycetota bacterium]
MAETFKISVDEQIGLVNSVKLYGEELLDQESPSNAALYVNGLPLKTRLHLKGDKEGSEHRGRLKGER